MNCLLTVSLREGAVQARGSSQSISKMEIEWGQIRTQEKLLKLSTSPRERRALTGTER